MKSLCRRTLIALNLIAFIFLVDACVRILGGDGHDFRAFYWAGRRLLDGSSPYVPTDAFIFKYAPPTAWLFAPFGALGFRAALTLFTILSGILPALLMGAVLALATHASSSPKHRWIAVGLGLLAATRFIDNEYHSANIGLWLFAMAFAAAWFALRGSRLAASGLFVLMSFFKLHPAMAALTWRPRAWGPLALWALVLVVPFFVCPPFWSDYAAILSSSSQEFTITRGGLFMQGFAPAGVLLLGIPQASGWHLSVFLPFLVGAAWLLPRFSWDEIPRQREAFLTTFFFWILFGALSAPLPWQHSFSLVCVIVPWLWLTGNALERRLTLVVALFLGFTARGLAGRALSTWLEDRQSVFFALAVLAFALMLQARRIKSATERR